MCGPSARGGGSVLYLFDVAGAPPIALGRGLRVILTEADGIPLRGIDHPIYTPVAIVVARPEVANVVVDAIRAVILPSFATYVVL